MIHKKFIAINIYFIVATKNRNQIGIIQVDVHNLYLPKEKIEKSDAV